MSVASEELIVPQIIFADPKYLNEICCLVSEANEYWLKRGIQIGQCIGDGQYGRVYGGRYSKDARINSSLEHLRGSEFAVKMRDGRNLALRRVPAKGDNPLKIQSIRELDADVRHEVMIARRNHLSHPNVIEFHFVEEYPKSVKVPDLIFIFMERAICSVQRLSQYLTEQNIQIPEKIALYWIKGLLQAIVYMHSKNILHNELVVSNFMVIGDPIYDESGTPKRFENVRIKVADFSKYEEMPEERDSFCKIKMAAELKQLVIAIQTITDCVRFQSTDTKTLLISHFNGLTPIDEILKSDLFNNVQGSVPWSINIKYDQNETISINDPSKNANKESDSIENDTKESVYIKMPNDNSSK